MDQPEVIAVVLSGEDSDADGAHSATVILRDAEGQMTSRRLSADDALVKRAERTGCFRRGKPIIDPVSRTVMGYELEEFQTATR